eukprot:SAG11_NODE_4927_length_1720_cov_1.256015_1_plen_89_part_00
MATLKAMKEHRPAASCLKEFIVAVMSDPKCDVSRFERAAEEGGSVYAYIKASGAFLLLKHAMLAVDHHRPDDPAKFVAAFLSTTSQLL